MRRLHQTRSRSSSTSDDSTTLYREGRLVMIRFVTGNENKVTEVSEHLDVPVEQFDYDYVEIQADDITSVARVGAAESYDALGDGDAVIVEDSGLFVHALGGFPGPYSAYVEETIGVEAVAQLTADHPDRTAHFESVVAYADGNRIKTFSGRVDGLIVPPRGDGGFGYDPIFEVDGQTLAERTTEEKNELSHRGQAVERFAQWYRTQS